MAATAAGAVAADGHTIGVTCAAFKRARPNPYIRQEVPTFDLLQRLNTLVRLGRAYVVLPGATGTLFELAAVWEFQNKRLLKPVRPVVLLGEFWKPVVDCVGEEQIQAVPLHVAEDPAQVAEILGQHFSDNE
jgi:predicted Rossmann-fold nucleotide-binding protein